jgi:hypothetical protein
MLREGDQSRKQIEFFRGYIQRGEHQANGRLWAWAKIQQEERWRRNVLVGTLVTQTPEELAREARGEPPEWYLKALAKWSDSPPQSVR